MLFTPSEASATSSKNPESERPRGIWPLGIRAQVSLWTSLVFVFLLVLFGTVFYMQLRATLDQNIDNTLYVRAQHISNGMTYKNQMAQMPQAHASVPANVTPPAVTPQSNPYQQWRARRNNSEFKTAERDIMQHHPDLAVDLDGPVRIFGSNGREIYSTPTFQVLNLPATIEQSTREGKPWIGTVSAHDGREVRLYSLPLKQNGKVYSVIQVGTSLSTLEETLNNVVYELMLVGPAVLLLGAFGSYLLACKAFKPIERLTSAARTITIGDLSQRVPVPRARDEVRRLALTFNEMIASLEAIFARQRRFTSDAAHELRTPVAAIRSMAEVALSERGELAGQDMMRTLRNITSESERLGALISDLLALARADEGQGHFEREPVRLDMLAQGVAATMEPLAQERDVQLQVDASEVVTTNGDEARLIQVVLNLVENALIYNQRGGSVMIEVRSEDERAILRVRDTGIGIAPEHLAHIFERFYRTDKARSRAAGGNGLGLSIVDWIVKMHQGKLDVQSEPEQGSTFSVSFPLAPATSQETRISTSIGASVG
ncbi:sensor histidine kinase [Ktedonospora formicarum]|uniref:histidine kinase n=1 Tax=Ktedonospora formicarum TaxID=2778364 RepID=A0A8J3MWY6_9CHLR|nr:HAMP domain-containing sensor histidine kinase [Ktedonospora formicarum]GHO49451.1 hypothetical protein KSX_76140 [Ktedonospora formicarum]